MKTVNCQLHNEGHRKKLILSQILETDYMDLSVMSTNSLVTQKIITFDDVFSTGNLNFCRSVNQINKL